MGNPSLAGVEEVSWVRRLFFNQAPAVAPVQITGSLSGPETAPWARSIPRETGRWTGSSQTTFDKFVVTASGDGPINWLYRWDKAFEPGSSISHVDDDTFTGATEKLMNAYSDKGLGSGS